MQFGVPMILGEPKNHHDDYYFCMVDMFRWNEQKKKDWYYCGNKSAQQPIPHCPNVPVPVITFLPYLTADEVLLEEMDGKATV